MSDTDHDTDRETAYDPPPAPPGVSVDMQYLAAVHAHGTRAIIEDNRRRTSRLVRELRADPERGPGLGGWLAARLGKLPAPLQTSLALGAMYLLMQLGGALYEGLTGRAPPQPTQPVTFGAAAAEPTPSEE